jgi:hypothetical protein
MGNWQKSLIGAGLSAALVPIVLSISVTPTRAQPPSRVAVKEPAATGCAEGPTVGQGRELRAGLSPEELELLGFQVEMERDQLRLAESRLEQAWRWEARARELAHSGRVPIEQVIVAQDSVLMRQSDVVAQRAALKAAELRLALAQRGTSLHPTPSTLHPELRLAQAQRGISSNWSLSSPSERRLAEVEQRLAAMERAVRRLRQETEHAQHDLPIQFSTDR